MKHYLLFVSVAYSYPILRPLQEEIRRRGDEVAWYIEAPCPDQLLEDERRLHSIQEVIDYNPVAVFAPGNHVYDFFPGVKVAVFHGYPIKKRSNNIHSHFTIRGWFDVYCTQGETATSVFRKLEPEYGYFKVYETGWCKVDDYFTMPRRTTPNPRPVVLYSSTFTQGISSASRLLPVVTEMIRTKPWDWIISLHPKLDNPTIVASYQKLAEDFPNVTFNNSIVTGELLDKIDLLLCDSSSIIVEAMLFDKPVVTFRNTNEENRLFDITDEAAVPGAIEQALTRPPEMMERIRTLSRMHEPHREGKNAAAVLDAVDDFILHHQGSMKKKPLNLFRKLKQRKQAGYFPFGKRIRPKR